MKVKIHPSRFILEKSFLGAKALIHRYLIASWLVNEGIMLDNVAENDDIDATLDFFKAIGREFVFTSNTSCYLKKQKQEKFDLIEVNVKSSTSTLLFLLPVSLHIAKKVIFKCDEELLNRSISTYEKLQTDCNLSIVKTNDSIICSGSINLDYFHLDGQSSSQFITGLIVNALYLKKAITIKVEEPFICKEYVLMSIAIFNQLGFDITIDKNTFYVHNHRKKLWDYIFVDADYSIASNYFTLACLNGSLTAYNFSKNTLQKDKIIIDLLNSIGGNIKFIENEERSYIYICNNALLEKGISKQLKSFSINLCDCVDLSPILMVLASFCNGKTMLKNYNLLVDKECERVNIMFDILSLLNVSIQKQNNDIIIFGKKDYTNNMKLPLIKDHRIIMALTVFSLLNKGCIEIDGIEYVNKSDPYFFENIINGTKTGAIEKL